MLIWPLRRLGTGPRAAKYRTLMEIYEMAMGKPVSETVELMAAR